MSGRASGIKNGGDGRGEGRQSIEIVGASACVLHFAPENPEDDEMYLLVLAHPDYPRHSPESHKMVVVLMLLCLFSVRSLPVTCYWWMKS